MTIAEFFPALPGLLFSVLAVIFPGARDIRIKQKNPVNYRVMFYNTENFFDIRNDSVTSDDEFTPRGAMHWNLSRYNIKLNNLYKTIVALGGWHLPDIIGFCEIENRSVLLDLTGQTPLAKYPYRVIHANSPDRRGIDVAALYNSKTVRLLQFKYFGIHKAGLYTRDILYFKTILDRDTFHFFMNHWPSRSAGQLRTETDRFAAAYRLSSLTDSLLKRNAKARIIIMGDFNDEPGDESMAAILKANTDLRSPSPGFLYNLSHREDAGKFHGTVKFRGQWNLFDQVIVSGSLLKNEPGLYVLPEAYHIFGESFLLINDDKFNGYKPFRTYNGYKYQGGFSDHLPVFIDLNVGRDEGRRTSDE